MITLYYFADGCSLATHIALRETGIEPRLIRVDPETRTTEDGRDFWKVNPKGYVPMLEFEDGSVLTENVAILDWVAMRDDAMRPLDEAERTARIEALTFISTEIHKTYLALFFLPGDEAKPLLRDALAGRFEWLTGKHRGQWLAGGRYSPADAFLYVMLRWAAGSNIAVSRELEAYRREIEKRPAVRAALAAEGLSPIG